jgi:hypothetical protein
MVIQNKTILAVTVIALTLVAIPALAQSRGVCLRLHDVYNTKIHDNSTLVATDRQRNKYTVNMRGACVGLTTNAQPLMFRPFSEFSCLRRGDRVSYSMPGEPLNISLYGSSGQSTCFIESVSEGIPAESETS